MGLDLLAVDGLDEAIGVDPDGKGSHTRELAIVDDALGAALRPMRVSAPSETKPQASRSRGTGKGRHLKAEDPHACRDKVPGVVIGVEADEVCPQNGAEQLLADRQRPVNLCNRARSCVMSGSQGIKSPEGRRGQAVPGERWQKSAGREHKARVVVESREPQGQGREGLRDALGSRVVVDSPMEGGTCGHSRGQQGVCRVERTGLKRAGQMTRRACRQAGPCPT